MRLFRKISWKPDKICVKGARLKRKNGKKEEKRIRTGKPRAPGRFAKGKNGEKKNQKKSAEVWATNPVRKFRDNETMWLFRRKILKKKLERNIKSSSLLFLLVLLPLFFFFLIYLFHLIFFICFLQRKVLYFSIFMLGPPPHKIWSHVPAFSIRFG